MVQFLHGDYNPRYVVTDGQSSEPATGSYQPTNSAPMPVKSSHTGRRDAYRTKTLGSRVSFKHSKEATNV